MLTRRNINKWWPKGTMQRLAGLLDPSVATAHTLAEVELCMTYQSHSLLMQRWRSLKVSDRHQKCSMRNCSGGVKFQRRMWFSAPLFKCLPPLRLHVSLLMSVHGEEVVECFESCWDDSVLQVILTSVQEITLTMIEIQAILFFHSRSSEQHHETAEKYFLSVRRIILNTF